jgi:putative hydrolase of the HAD superfamily
MRTLRAILFDIDDTLCATTGFARRARRNAVRAMIAAGVRADPEQVYAELEEVIAEFSSNYEHHFDKLLLRLEPRATEHLNRALVVAAGVAAYHDTKFRELKPFPGVHELLHDLAAAGLRLGVITHGLTVKQAEKLVRLKLVGYLDPEAIFISDQIGISKPNPKLYASALRSLGLAANETMYVGDNPRNDIAPPKSLGMITVWARGSAKQAAGDVLADHEVDSFADLRELLRTSYGLDLPAETLPRT